MTVSQFIKVGVGRDLCIELKHQLQSKQLLSSISCTFKLQSFSPLQPNQMSISVKFLVICLLLGVVYSMPAVVTRQRRCAHTENSVCSIVSVYYAIQEGKVSITLITESCVLSVMCMCAFIYWQYFLQCATVDMQALANGSLVNSELAQLISSNVIPEVLCNLYAAYLTATKLQRNHSLACRVTHECNVVSLLRTIYNSY